MRVLHVEINFDARKFTKFIAKYKPIFAKYKPISRFLIEPIAIACCNQL